MLLRKLILVHKPKNKAQIFLEEHFSFFTSVTFETVLSIKI